MAKAWNKKIFKNIHEKVNQASKDLAEEEFMSSAAEYGYERFSNKTAIVQQHLFIICGVSPGVEPIAANSYWNFIGIF